MHHVYKPLIEAGIATLGTYTGLLGVYALSLKLSGQSWRDTARRTLGISRAIPNIILYALLHPRSPAEVDIYTGRVVKVRKLSDG